MGLASALVALAICEALLLALNDLKMPQRRSSTVLSEATYSGSASWQERRGHATPRAAIIASNHELDHPALRHPIANARNLFAVADYRRMWAIGAFCGVARWLEFVAIAIFAYELTHSPELVALLAVLRMLPYVLLGFGMGALADAVDRKPLLIASLLFMAVVSGAMAFLTLSGAAGYALVAAATMASGAFWTTDMPVRRRLLVDAVAQNDLAAALGFDNSTMYAARALGPLIGGTTYQFLGIEGIYVCIGVGD